MSEQLTFHFPDSTKSGHQQGSTEEDFGEAMQLEQALSDLPGGPHKNLTNFCYNNAQ
jgi:hypothetical protein